MIKVDKVKKPKIGIAHSEYIPNFIKNNSEHFDYIEVPYELLMHNNSIIELIEQKPIVLHCASLSIAGSVFPSLETIKSLTYWIEQTETPWLGEHLSFISAKNADAIKYGAQYAPGEPYNIGYTMPPPLNEQSLEEVIRAVKFAQGLFDVPLLLENPPIYFNIPGSSISQVNFIKELVAETGVNLLLDLAHFLITSKNEGNNVKEQLQQFPLEKVVEIHISGLEIQDGIFWDNHACGAPEEEIDLLKMVLQQVIPQAITLEYNWNAKFPENLLMNEINKIKQVTMPGFYAKK